jgi:hypothetical protein
MIKDLLAQIIVSRQKKNKFPIPYLEQKHVDLSLPYPNDSSFFYGGDKAGNAFICRMAFRGPARKKELWFDFFLKDHGFYGITDEPGPEGPGFQMGSVKWEPLEVGKTWRITYEGRVAKREGTIHSCRLDLVFTGETPIYDYVDSSDRKAIARAVAKERWTKDFFFKMKDLEQIHIEQTGSLKGTINLDDQQFNIEMRSMKDHSFGSRNWLTWDRHYWISGLADNGYHWTVTTIRFQFVGRLTAGFVIGPDGKADAIVDCTDLESVSSKKLLPDHETIKIITRSGKKHTIEFWRNGHFPYLMDDTYIMKEAIGTYRFDGIPGLGMVEFGFHKDLYPEINVRQ